VGGAVPHPERRVDRELREVELSVVVPVRNEADNVVPLLGEIHAALDGRLAYEVIYVNDGSTDATGARLVSAARQFPRLRVIHHAESCGQSTALWSGVRAARAPWIATLDGDGQNDPADIPKLLAMLHEPGTPANLRLITGHRRKRRDSRLRRLSSRIANGVRARLLGDRTPDTGCGLKLIHRDSYLALPFFDHMHRFLPALVQRGGGVTASVEVEHRPRTRGRSNYGVRDRLWAGIVDLIGVMWLKRRMRYPRIVDGTVSGGDAS
jgi:dolichol-phosphate mannosyltransferase